ncbi:hypothetical protein G4B88_006491 [Cannabis sativa]|uniref:Uncharacterized protein n=1 Tax=Cannabis sativa TaxID=3483 RepID=A0A7J6H2G6_CANSA|nr:hypothetical protein G4B88_006491 [Cannabis sativa]
MKKMEKKEHGDFEDELEENLEEIMELESDELGSNESWRKQITCRGVIASVVIGTIYSIIAMKLNLTTGMVPHFNVSAALLAFIFIRTWTQLLQRFGYQSKPFTRQENTIIQTCSVACYSIAVGGGFASYLLGLNKKTYELSGVHNEGNSINSTKEPGLGWMVAFLFLVCFVGLFVLIPLRKIMIVDLKLTYPSGLATAVLINGFHTRGDKMAKFFFDFSTTYVGAGMICSHLVNLSLLLGAVISYGVMWPLIGKLKGDWFPQSLSESDMKSLYGYKAFLSVSLILGDGLYNFVKILASTIINMHQTFKDKNNPETRENKKKSGKAVEEKQNQIFLGETIPLWIAITGYVILSSISTIVIPIMFPQLKWYYVVVSYLLAPSLAFCNAYGTGLTDINMAYNYGKIALFILAAITGKQNGVVAALAGCGLIKSVVSVACILMQDFKTGHLTLTSPRAMFASQVIGTALGCIIAPLSFFLFYKAFDVGNPKGEFKAPYALIYRNMAILGVQGFSALPRHCLQLCWGFFGFAVGVNLVRDLSPVKIGKWMPLPMVMGVPFLVGAYFAIDMCVGTLIVFVWEKIDAKKAELMAPAVASGLICGEGMWILPASVLALAKVKPPICMKFLSS